MLSDLIAFCITTGLPLILVLVGAVVDYRRWKRGDGEPCEGRPERKDSGERGTVYGWKAIAASWRDFFDVLYPVDVSGSRQCTRAEEEPSENRPEREDQDMENDIRPGGNRYGWPRFDDGAPVSIGDAVEIPGLPGVAMVVEAIEANREGVWVKDAPEGDFLTAVPASHIFSRPRSLEAGEGGHAVETCRMEFDTVHHDHKCSACGAFVRTDASRRLDCSASLKYCPNCGRKVIG